MNGLNVIVCKAQAIACRIPTRNDQMEKLIGLFVQIAQASTGIMYDCASLEALGEQFACIPRPLQLPVLIALATTMQPQSVTGFGQQVFDLNFGGFGNLPTFTPSVPAAVNFDPTDGTLSWWINGTWNQ
jgi:hypothetical protein